MVWRTAVGCMAAFIAQAALAANVKVTPLGGQDGEFCPHDRALIFEDPNGTRILYDAGRTVAGPNDPRLGKIDIIRGLSVRRYGDHGRAGQGGARPLSGEARRDEYRRYLHHRSNGSGLRDQRSGPARFGDRVARE